MSGKKWRKVSEVRVWRPAKGDALEGFFGGTQLINGVYGQYQVVILHTEIGTFSVSGCKAVSLIKGAGALGREDKIKFVFKGAVKASTDNNMKDFDLYVLR